MKQMAFCDGAVKANGKPHALAGWGAVVVQTDSPEDPKKLDRENSIIRIQKYGLVVLDDMPDAPDFIGAEKHSNNTGELTAIYWAIRLLEKAKANHGLIVTDSRYSIRSIRGQFAPGANWPLIKTVRNAYLTHDGWYKLVWIKGHLGYFFNEWADGLAKRLVHGQG